MNPTLYVTEIPTPWAHPYGLVVGVEYPANRPMVVDLVLADGHRTAETRTALYAQLPTGTWDLARHILDPAQLPAAIQAAEDRAYAADSDTDRACDWCGETEPMVDSDTRESYPVEVTGADAYHAPCRESAEDRAARHQAKAVRDADRAAQEAAERELTARARKNRRNHP